MAQSTEEPILNDYEKRRAENIERNNARLKKLGLISALEEKRSNAQAWGRHDEIEHNDIVEEGEDSDDADEAYSESETSRKRMLSRGMEPSRKSRRLKGEEPENILSNEHSTNSSSTKNDCILFESTEERQARVEECRRARLRAALEVAKAGASAAGKNNPTATYDHCLMRVQTMTPKALESRVKVIERAAGRHCVVKMAIFKSCLQDEGMWELAKLASDALERLKAAKPPPKD
mmetsp:Transcript_1633/g.2407  ORF Transcript_1633/g.2407 Transcript_1633/m.2407 type:complete len:234 (+) Transcript_1633:58-759(+)